jgi:hypothetical protein
MKRREFITLLGGAERVSAARRPPRSDVDSS